MEPGATPVAAPLQFPIGEADDFPAHSLKRIYMRWHGRAGKTTALVRFQLGHHCWGERVLGHYQTFTDTSSFCICALIRALNNNHTARFLFFCFDCILTSDSFSSSYHFVSTDVSAVTLQRPLQANYLLA